MHRGPRSRWILLLSICAAAGVVACSERPDAARIDNPFDPDVGAADPFGLRAQFVNGAVEVSWEPLHLSDGGILSYLISHALTPGGTFGLVAEVQVASTPNTKFRHLDYIRDSYNYYIVQARKADGISATSIVKAVGIRTAPTASLTSGLGTTGLRESEFRLRPLLSSGESFELSRESNFSVFSSYDAAAVASDVLFDLGPASRGDFLKLYSRVRRGCCVDSTGVDSVEVALRVRMTADLNASSMVDDTLLTVDISELEGVTRLRLARTAAGLAIAPWEVVPPGETELTRVRSLDPAEIQHAVFGEFEADFGFTQLDTVQADAQLVVNSVSFKFVDSALAEVNTTAEDTVSIFATTVTGVTQMRYSEDLAFTGVPWLAFQPFHLFELTPGLGDKTVYGQYRNPFSNTVAAQATITRTAP